MRPVSATPLPPGVERRRQLRRERRADRLRNLWRLLVFSSVSAGLGYVLLREGWNLQNPSHVEVVGTEIVTRDQVIQAAGMSFPQPLLGLNPKGLGQTLSSVLPVTEVKVTRLMLPPRLRVELVDRQAVARAQRRTPGGIDNGYVDLDGEWISSPKSQGVKVSGNPNVKVIGWHSRHRPVLAQVLAQLDRIGPGLKEIRFDPDGRFWLVTADLGRLQLGPSQASLDRQLEVVDHLHRKLPKQVRRRQPRLIDLTDPEQPEVSLAAPPKSTAKPKGSGPSTASSQNGVG